MNKAVFIDRDGTLIKDVPYNINPDLIEYEKDAIKTLALLKQNKFLLILISNQSGIAKGFFSVEELEKMHHHIQQTLTGFNTKLDAIYYCPHLPEGKIEQYSFECDCRKPKPGLILKAASDLNIDVSNSWMIGDILNDIEAGNVAGCKTILLDNGNETEWIVNDRRKPAFTLHSWKTIGNTILANNKVILTDG